MWAVIYQNQNRDSKNTQRLESDYTDTPLNPKYTYTLHHCLDHARECVCVCVCVWEWVCERVSEPQTKSGLIWSLNSVNCKLNHGFSCFQVLRVYLGLDFASKFSFYLYNTVCKSVPKHRNLQIKLFTVDFKEKCISACFMCYNYPQLLAP